jgi:hypothetical protein
MTPPPEDTHFVKLVAHEKRSVAKRTPDDMRYMARELDAEAQRRTTGVRLRARLSAYRDSALLLASPFGRIYRRWKT